MQSTWIDSGTTIKTSWSIDARLVLVRKSHSRIHRVNLPTPRRMEDRLPGRAISTRVMATRVNVRATSNTARCLERSTAWTHPGIPRRPHQKQEAMVNRYLRRRAGPTRIHHGLIPTLPPFRISQAMPCRVPRPPCRSGRNCWSTGIT